MADTVPARAHDRNEAGRTVRIGHTAEVSFQRGFRAALVRKTLFVRVLDGRYRLGERLGRGGTSEVFRGTDLRLGRAVAVKVLSADIDDPQARARFEREAYALSSFVHPNAVAIFDAGFDGEQPYLVMELVDGPPLSSSLHSRGPLAVSEAIGITDQVLAALGAAHRRGLVHRDVKPSNILLGPDGRVRLADFGIAKSITDLTRDLTATGHIVGTVSYLAPEVARGDRATPASDLYAVGVVLFEMLTGEVPLRGDTPLATLTARDRADPPSVCSLRPGVPAALDAAIMKALSRDATRRFAAARGMRDAIAATESQPRVQFGPEPTAPDAAAPYPTAPYAAAPDAAAPEPATEVPGRSARRPRRRRLLTRLVAPLVVLGIGAGAVLGIATSTTDPNASNPPRATGRTDTPGSTVPRTTAPPTTIPPTTTTLPSPSTLAELAAALDVPDGRYGAQQQTLRDRLLNLVDRNHGKEAKGSVELARDVSRWASAGQLDPVIANDAIRLLGALQPSPAQRGKPGRFGKHED